jgi:hypothetical protein
MKNTTLAMITIVAAVGLLGVVVIESISIPQQQADAQSSTGQCARALQNASAQFCHNLGG